MKKKILITGTTGMLGSEIIRVFSSIGNYEIFGLGRSVSTLLPHENQFMIDLIDHRSIENLKFSPDVIIHTAAMTDLNLCENEPKLANEIHVKGSEAISKIGGSQTKMFYISTDSVFDGQRGNYSETDSPNPINEYAKSKLLGEYAVQKVNSEVTVIRTNIYGLHSPIKNSIAEWAIQEWVRGKPINGYTDLMFNALYTHQLACVLEFIISNNIFFPVINIGSNSVVSKFEFLNELRKALNINSDLLNPSISSQGSIRRPKNTTLDITLLSTFYTVPEFDSGIKALAKALSSQLIHNLKLK